METDQENKYDSFILNYLKMRENLHNTSQAAARRKDVGKIGMCVCIALILVIAFHGVK